MPRTHLHSECHGPHLHSLCSTRAHIDPMLYYAVLCYVQPGPIQTLCYAMFNQDQYKPYAMLCYAMVCYVQQGPIQTLCSTRANTNLYHANPFSCSITRILRCFLQNRPEQPRALCKPYVQLYHANPTVQLFNYTYFTMFSTKRARAAQNDPEWPR